MVEKLLFLLGLKRQWVLTGFILNLVAYRLICYFDAF